MARPVTLLALFFLSMNLFAGLLMTSGVAGMVGAETVVGGDEQVSEAVNQSGDIDSGAPTGSTLFGMYQVLADGVRTLAAPVRAGPQMLKRLPLFPDILADAFLQPLIVMVYAVGIISFMRGWGL